MICPQCRIENPQAHTYCSNCGSKLSGMAPASDPIFSTLVSTSPVFSEKELKILIDINRKVAATDAKLPSVIQEDIDKLFE